MTPTRGRWTDPSSDAEIADMASSARLRQRPAHARDNFGGKTFRLPEHVLVVGPEDEAVKAQFAYQADELLGPVRGGTAQPALLRPAGDPAVHVRHPADTLRIAAGRSRRLVDHRLTPRDLVKRQPGQAWDPAVGQTADQADHARPISAHPDPDVMSRGRTAVGAVQAVVTPVEVDATLPRPDTANDLDRLLERVDGLRPRAYRAAPGLDPLPKGACPETELEASAAEPVDRGRRLGEAGRRAERQVRDVGKEADTLGPRGEVRDQHPRVEEPPLVGVILDPDEVEAEPVSRQHLLYELVLPISLGNREYAEEPLHVQHAA